MKTTTRASSTPRAPRRAPERDESVAALDGVVPSSTRARARTRHTTPRRLERGRRTPVQRRSGVPLTPAARTRTRKGTARRRWGRGGGAEATCCARAGASAMAERRTAAAAAALEQCLDAFDDLGRWTTARAAAVAEANTAHEIAPVPPRAEAASSVRRPLHESRSPGNPKSRRCNQKRRRTNLMMIGRTTTGPTVCWMAGAARHAHGPDGAHSCRRRAEGAARPAPGFARRALPVGRGRREWTPRRAGAGPPARARGASTFSCPRCGGTGAPRPLRRGAVDGAREEDGGPSTTAISDGRGARRTAREPEECRVAVPRFRCAARAAGRAAAARRGRAASPSASWGERAKTLWLPLMRGAVRRSAGTCRGKRQ